MLSKAQSKNVQKRMIDAELTGADIARMCNTSRQNVSNVIRGRSSSAKIEGFLKKI